MRFALKKPCQDCPFVKGNCLEIGLPRERVQQILDDVNSNKTFPCHKYESPVQNCAGSALFVTKIGIPNSSLQIAERLGIFNMEKLSLRQGTELYQTEQEMLGAYNES